MQFSINATGPAAGFGDQITAQVASEKARLAREAEDFVEHIVNSGENLKVHKKIRTLEFPGLPAAARALDAVAAFIAAEIAHVGPQESVAVSVNVTVHRPDPELPDPAKK